MNAPSTDLLQGVAQLARLGGRPLSPIALQAQCTRERDGRLSVESLRSALAASGLEFARSEGSLAQLERAGLPALAALDGGGYRVIAAVDELLSADVKGAYAGHFFTLRPRPAPDMRSEIPARRNARAWFWRVLWGLRHYYAHVALATLLVNLLSIAVSLYVMNVYDRVVPNRTYETLWVLTIGTVGALVFDFAARTLRGWLVDIAGKRADMEISSGLFQRLLGIQLIQKPASSGAFVSNLRDFEAIRDVLTSATLTALIDLPFFLLFVAVIASIAAPLAIVPLVAIVLVVIVGALVQAPLARSIRDSMKEGSQRQGLAVETGRRPGDAEGQQRTGARAAALGMVHRDGRAGVDALAHPVEPGDQRHLDDAAAGHRRHGGDRRLPDPRRAAVDGRPDRRGDPVRPRDRAARPGGGTGGAHPAGTHRLRRAAGADGQDQRTRPRARLPEPAVGARRPGVRAASTSATTRRAARCSAA